MGSFISLYRILICRLGNSHALGLTNDEANVGVAVCEFLLPPCFVTAELFLPVTLSLPWS